MILAMMGQPFVDRMDVESAAKAADEKHDRLGAGFAIPRDLLIRG